MEIQRSEGIFKEEFELDKASIQSLMHSSAGPTDLQPSQALGGPSKRIMPASMRSTDTPGPPARNSGGFQVHVVPCIHSTLLCASGQQFQGCSGSGCLRNIKLCVDHVHHLQLLLLC